MDRLLVSPVFDVPSGSRGLKHDRLLRLPKCYHNQDLVLGWYGHCLAEFCLLDGTDDAPPQSCLCRAEQDALRGYPVVASEGLSDRLVAQDDDVCGWPFTFLRAWPVLEIASPRQVCEDERIHLRITGQDVLQGLPVGCGCREPRKVDEFLEGFKADRHVLVKPAVASVLEDQFSDHDG